MVLLIEDTLGPSVHSPGQWFSTEGVHASIHIARGKIHSEDMFYPELTAPIQ
jgi:hypothetical protein